MNQHIGIKDKNGKLIREGDRILFNIKESIGKCKFEERLGWKFTQVIGTVVLHNAAFMLTKVNRSPTCMQMAEEYREDIYIHYLVELAPYEFVILNR